MTADELREQFIQFFEKKGHTRFPSQPLVPPNDPSLLFSNAGMNPFKERFQGLGDKKLIRACSVQKCLRTGDVDAVGRTPFHQSFFEMLGNFSFGDYFKEEAIALGWELVTDVLGLSAEKLAVSVYTEDDEAAQIWRDTIGLAESQIVRLGEKENFWPASAPSKGPNGPCGPCSEIFYNCGEPVTGAIDLEDGRWVEIYNLVFMQYERKEDGTLVDLPMKSIDTGMGLERTLAVINGVSSSYETDLFIPIIDAICEIAGLPCEGDNLPRIRRIADHARAAAFCIADGVKPSNEGRGYVLRKLIRRAVLNGRHLGLEKTFLHTLVPTLAAVMSKPYPEVGHGTDRIATMIRTEEESFSTTLEQGITLAEAMIKESSSEGSKQLSGADAFRLYDTHGVPLEVTEEVAEQHGMAVDRAGFEREMEKQRERARAGSKMAKDVFGASAVAEIRGSVAATEFTGYEGTEADGKVLALIQNGKVVTSAGEGEVVLIVDRTPFYVAAGGQLSDVGGVTAKGVEIEVSGVQKDGDYILHQGTIKSGTIKTGLAVRLAVDAERRLATMRNHTATHIMHQALREILGEHVQQAGSEVSAERLRFDFSQPNRLTDDEVRSIERYVNERILADAEVTTTLTTVEEARKQGAMALFDEKYGDEVRLVHMGDFSHELCGGTHMARTGGIGPFIITQETSISAGTRRIEAITGEAALAHLAANAKILSETCQTLKTTPLELTARVEKLLAQVKELKRAKPKGEATADLTALLKKAETVGGATLLVTRLPDGTDPKTLRELADRLCKQGKNGTAVFLAAAGPKAVGMVAALTADLVKRGLHAGRLIQAVAPVVGGGGGGRPEMAEAGGRQADKLDEALELARTQLREALG